MCLCGAGQGRALTWKPSEAGRLPCVQLSLRQALAHLKVSVHDLMLVNMIDTLQDLIDALAEKQNNKSISGR